MSQIFCLGSGFDFMTKKGNFCHFLSFFLIILTSTSHKTKTKPYINILRHASLPIDLSNMYTNFKADISENN